MEVAFKSGYRSNTFYITCTVPTCSMKLLLSFSRFCQLYHVHPFSTLVSSDPPWDTIGHGARAMMATVPMTLAYRLALPVAGARETKHLVRGLAQLSGQVHHGTLLINVEQCSPYIIYMVPSSVSPPTPAWQGIIGINAIWCLFITMAGFQSHSLISSEGKIFTDKYLYINIIMFRHANA